MSHQLLRPVRGTHDWLAQDAALYRHVVDRAQQISACYGCGEIMTPIFEFSEVFHRTLGESSDIVGKETYQFTDRGGESLTLRPENTASVVRAFLSNGLQSQTPCKFFYVGPMFRYERPQKGRMRQFHQFGVEFLGLGEWVSDVETIALGADILQALGVSSLVGLQLNTLGDAASRQAYRQALIDYLTPLKDQLSEDSQARLSRNPLRILDSKNEQDKALVANAPKMSEFLNDESQHHFAQVKQGLNALSIPFVHNETLVRGLDYYDHTVFEFTTDALGSQGAVLSGGRYNGLVEQMGGAPTPGIGFAAGIERLVELIRLVNAVPATEQKKLALIPMLDAAMMPMLTVQHRLRQAGYIAEMLTSGAMGKRMKRADKMGATIALIMGEDELANHSITLRHMADGSQQSLTPDALESYLQSHS